MSKIIAIPGWKVGENSFGVTTHYLDFISQYGIPRIVFPNEDLVDCDLLILPGGLDIAPSSFGEAPGFYTSNTDVFKQHFFDKKLKLYVESATPIFGICLGMQQLAAYFGSKVTQNFLYHAQSKDRWVTAHKLFPSNDFAKNIAPHKFEVNSHHHQGVTLSNLSASLTPLFTAENEGFKEDPIVEVFIHNELPIYGVQYHPEELRDCVSDSLIKSLL